MSTPSSIGVVDATTPDKYIHTEQRTVSAKAREAQGIFPVPGVYATYSAIAHNISTATASSHVLQIMGDGSNYSRLLSVRIQGTEDVPASAAVTTIELYRLITAGTGGTAVTCREYDTADTYAGGAMTLPTVKGTEGDKLYQWRFVLPDTLSDHIAFVEWHAPPAPAKPIIFGTSAANGLAFKMNSGIASATVDIIAEFATTDYL